MKNIKQNKAFTLLEVMVAVTLLGFTAMSIWSISTQTDDSVQQNDNKVTAMYLAQEGLELIRNKRDTAVSKSESPAKISNGTNLIWNQNSGWYKFMTSPTDCGFNQDLNKPGIVYKKIKEVSGFYTLTEEKVSHKKIASIGDIKCNNYETLTGCNLEGILLESTSKSEDKINSSNRAFYRRIVLSKKENEPNLINVRSEIYREEKGTFSNFVLEQTLGNITIY